MKNNKKIIITLSFIIVVLVIILSITGIVLLTNKSDDNSESTKTESKTSSKDSKIKVTKNETSTIKYDTYDNGLVSFKYPKGWTVDVAPVDYIHYSFRVFNPENPDYMFLFGLKLEGFLKSELARTTYAGYYPGSVFATLPAIDPQTTEGFFKVWNEAAECANTIDLKYAYFPKFNNFEIVENLGQGIIGGDILRATYTNANGKKVQGLFTASVYSAGQYMISTDMWNPFASQVDVWPLNVYNIITMTAPDEEFTNWQPILDECLASIEFSQTFINGFNQEETTVTQTIIANQKVYDSISDSIMDSWEKRNNSYDIISQKQSDATLGYDRVYDTDTGEIYKAPNGFMDHYDGTKYEPITDNMYTMPTAGYIE